MASRDQLLNEPRPRRFQLYRRRDATGISGTGVVAEGIEFRDGVCAYRWLTAPGTTQIAGQVEDIRHIHGHSGGTEVRYLDDPGPAGDDKTLTQVYEDRNRLAVAFSTLAKDAGHMADAVPVPGPTTAYSGGWHPPTDEDDADADEWAVTWATLPTGQVSWHVPRALVDVVDADQVALDYDGHDRTEKNDRLLKYASTDW